MKQKSKLWLVALLAVSLLGAACGSDDDDAGDATLPSVPAGSTMEAIQKRGNIRIGVKFDQPGFGLKNPATNKVEGFDVEIGKLIAKRIFGANSDSKIRFSETPTGIREHKANQGEVDLVIATYTINDARKQSVAFAGPYFLSAQDIMVKASDTSIKKVQDLNNKRVCTQQGSTSLTNLLKKENAPNAQVDRLPSYAACVANLDNGNADAVTTDKDILAGLIKTSGNKFKLVGAPFSAENYGIGMQRGHPEFRNFINDVIEEIVRTGEYKKVFEATLTPATGAVYADPPPVDRYTETGETVTPTTATTVAKTSTTAGATTTSS